MTSLVLVFAASGHPLIGDTECVVVTGQSTLLDLWFGGVPDDVEPFLPRRPGRGHMVWVGQGLVFRPHPVVIGDKRAGREDPSDYPVQAPFGDEVILAVASATPLFTAARPFVEPAGAYLAALEQALAVPAGQTPPQASTVWLTTVAHH